MVPLFAVLWFLDHKYAPISTAATFIAAAVTDWLDGFLARKARRDTDASWCGVSPGMSRIQWAADS